MSRIYKIYTDGSNDKNVKVGWGFLVVKTNEIIFEDYGEAHPEYNESRNINGEIQAVIEALTWCMENGINEVSVYHDYNGISKWATGEWSASKPISKYFKEFLKHNTVKVEWIWVKGHSGNEFNERADFLARCGRAPQK